MSWIEINPKEYVDSKTIKFLINKKLTKNKSVKDFVDGSKLNVSQKYIHNKWKSETLSLIILNDNTVLESSYSLSELYTRVYSDGKKMIQVHTEAYVSVEYIKVIFDYSKGLLTELKPELNMTASELQFIRQNKRCGLLLMTTGEIVSLSDTSADIVAMIEKL